MFSTILGVSSYEGEIQDNPIALCLQDTTFVVLERDSNSNDYQLGFCSLIESFFSDLGLFSKYHNTICLPSKYCISIVFSSDLQSPQEKLKTMLMQNFGGTTKELLFFLKKANCIQLKIRSLYWNFIQLIYIPLVYIQ